MAAGVSCFVDDLRPVGPSEEECWAITHPGLPLRLHGIANSPPCQHPGAWAGLHVVIHDDGIGVTCGADKWCKAQRLLRDLAEELSQSPRLHHKSLEQRRSFFVHLQWTYPCITPFLQGIHLTVDIWRPGCDSDGWKLPPSSFDADMELEWGLAFSEAPEFFTAVPRLYDDLTCLTQLF